jgi:hypothetical protein
MTRSTVVSEPRPAWQHDEARERRGVMCYVRDDLGGCLTAVVSQLADGRWAARLFTRPGSSIEVTRTHRVVAERLASEHSDHLAAEMFRGREEQTP